ncbi:hypothetical protein BC828DRAFT_393971 [Blastocladiella britannica]|nr:hypothetical protein BC828DRAFT_393971 [Blastocladiella britannica]
MSSSRAASGSPSRPLERIQEQQELPPSSRPPSQMAFNNDSRPESVPVPVSSGSPSVYSSPLVLGQLQHPHHGQHYQLSLQHAVSATSVAAPADVAATPAATPTKSAGRPPAKKRKRAAAADAAAAADSSAAGDGTAGIANIADESQPVDDPFGPESDDGEGGTAADKRKRHLERNRAAAARSRQKRREWLQNLEQNHAIAQSRNSQLLAEAHDLRTTILGLRGQLVAHKACGPDCNVVPIYSAEARHPPDLAIVAPPVVDPNTVGSANGPTVMPGGMSPLSHSTVVAAADESVADEGGGDSS